jgi:hypothetical protein
MPARKRTTTKRARDKAETGRLYLQGLSQAEIGEKLGLSQRQISYDLAELRKEWESNARKAMAERRAETIAKLRQVEQVAWEEWVRSRGVKIRRKATRTVTSSGVVERTEVVTEERTGCSRLLVAVRKALERQCQLLGIDSSEPPPPALVPMSNIIVKDRADWERIKEVAKREKLHIVDINEPDE